MIQVLVEACKKTHEPIDFFACADWHEEQGNQAMAKAYRWMGKKGRWPAHRTGERIKKPYAWYNADAYIASELERKRYEDNPNSWVEVDLFFALVTGSTYTIAANMKPYTSWEEAVEDLAKALQRMKRVGDF